MRVARSIMTVLVIGLVVGAVPSTSSSAATPVDLSDGWGNARACAVFEDHVQCFASEAQMDRALARSAEAADVALAASCSTPTRLYSATSFGGSVLALAARGINLNLADYSFDNRTRSYRIGACPATFFDGSGAGGAIYPGNTAANAQASTMGTWAARVSSVRIS